MNYTLIRYQVAIEVVAKGMDMEILDGFQASEIVFNTLDQEESLESILDDIIAYRKANT